MQKFLEKFFELRGIGLDQWFVTLSVRSQRIPRDCTSDTCAATWKSSICVVATHGVLESLAPAWRAAGISDAEGVVWDSVSRGGRNNCEALGNCLYKECTMLVHQKVKEKKINLYQLNAYFFYRGLAYHCSWLFLIIADASAGCTVGDGTWLARSQGTEAFIGATQRQAICKTYLFFSYLSSLNKNVML